MAKPLNLNFKITDFSFSYKSVDFLIQSEIPIGIHPGAFGVRRKHHIHEGVDLYCYDGEDVFSMLDGYIRIESPHIRVHNCASEAIKAKKDDNYDRVLEMVADMESASLDVIDNLEKMAVNGEFDSNLLCQHKH